MEELLAQVIEEVSVLAADRRRKEPRKVRRPFMESAGGEQSPQLIEHAGGGRTAVGHEAMLAMFRPHVRASAPASGATGG